MGFVSGARVRQQRTECRRTDEPDSHERIVLLALSLIACPIRTALFRLVLSRWRELLLAFTFPPRLPTLLARLDLLAILLPGSYARLAALLLDTFPVYLFSDFRLPSCESLGVLSDDRRRRKKGFVRAAEGREESVSSGRWCGGEEAGVCTYDDEMSSDFRRQDILESSKLRQERWTSLTLRVLAPLFLLVALHQHDFNLRTSLGMSVSLTLCACVLLEVAPPSFAHPARDEVRLRQDEDDRFRVRLEGAEVVAERWRVVEEREANVCESTTQRNQLRRPQPLKSRRTDQNQQDIARLDRPPQLSPDVEVAFEEGWRGRIVVCIVRIKIGGSREHRVDLGEPFAEHALCSTVRVSVSGCARDGVVRTDLRSSRPASEVDGRRKRAAQRFDWYGGTASTHLRLSLRVPPTWSFRARQLDIVDFLLLAGQHDRLLLALRHRQQLLLRQDSKTRLDRPLQLLHRSLIFCPFGEVFWQANEPRLKLHPPGMLLVARSLLRRAVTLPESWLRGGRREE